MQNLVTIITVIFASGGFWAFVTAALTERRKKRDALENELGADHQLLLGLAHDRLYALCAEYISRGSITMDEYDNLKYIYDPYVQSGGNGTGKRLMEEVEKIPIREGTNNENY